MNDSFPMNLAIEIDRDRLRKYLRTKWLLGWMGGLGAFGVLSGAAAVSKMLEGKDFIGLPASCVLIAKAVGTGLLVSLVVAFVLYLTLSHRHAAEAAAGVHVRVEGPFLCIQKTGFLRVDRKVHFRAIVDYSVVESTLMHRYGIVALRMTTSAHGPSSILEIYGIKDCRKIRDMLAEIDALRENG